MSKILDTIGKTPVVEITKLNPNPKVKILAKLEGFNPAGSVKDRICLYMIKYAEKEGKLTKDKIILEATSGNTGIGLAMVGAIKGYTVQVVMPETMSEEKKTILRAFGVCIILTPGEKGMSGAIERVKELAKNTKRYFVPNQFENPYNVLAHYETTGKEILEQVGKVDVFVAGIGTGGTITGVGRRLKEVYPQTKVVGVEPKQGSKIQGLRNLLDYTPPIIDLNLIDERVIVEDESAFEMTRELTKREGIFVGISSGAAMVEAYRQASLLKEGVVLVIFPDRGDKYLSTELFSEPSI